MSPRLAGDISGGDRPAGGLETVRMPMPDLLLEILSEEIPARMQPKARDDLRALILKGFDEAGIAHDAAEAYSTPRRLTLHVSGLPERTPDLREERKGPRTDAPEKALAGFLRSTGLSADQLERRPDKKGEVFFAVIERPGRSVSDAVADIVPGVIRGFPWPKSMRWGSGELRWVRPITSILCLLDEAVVPFEVDGYSSGNETRGHRFADPAPFAVSGFADYKAGLLTRKVVLDAGEREEIIMTRAVQLCADHGVSLLEDRALQREVSCLVEWPVPLIGEIEDTFRALPAEVLQTAMREHQKYFAAIGAEDRITRFVAVANTEGADGGATILNGNTRVLRARLADAKFFWENDLRAVADGGLHAMAAPLADVTFHNRLGSQAERIDRIALLSRELTAVTGADAALAEEAARVCKADLASEMVYEFPELQGIMGRYYAKAAGLDASVARACEYHYAPLGPSDAVPTEAVAATVALADKIDMLAGFWAADEKPTGSKDPFALRRAALGVIRILLENGIRVHLSEPMGVALMRHVYLMGRRDAKALGEPLFDALDKFNVEGGSADQRAAFENLVEFFLSPQSGLAEAVEPGFADEMRATVADLLGFVAERLKVALRERGIRHDLIDAVYALGDQDDIVLLVKRVEALQEFLGTGDGANLLAGYKRAANILAAEAKKDGGGMAALPNPALAEQEEERALFQALAEAEAPVAGALRGSAGPAEAGAARPDPTRGASRPSPRPSRPRHLRAARGSPSPPGRRSRAPHGRRGSAPRASWDARSRPRSPGRRPGAAPRPGGGRGRARPRRPGARRGPRNGRAPVDR